MRLQTLFLHIPTEKALLKMRSPNSLSVGMLNWFVSQQMRTAFSCVSFGAHFLYFKEEKTNDKENGKKSDVGADNGSAVLCC